MTADAPDPADKTAAVAAAALAFQALACRKFGSPFSADFLDAAGRDLAAGRPAARLLAPFAGLEVAEFMGRAVPIRLLAAFHDLALSGEEPDLTAAHPTADRPGDGEAAWTAAARATDRHLAELAAFMEHEPQTNEARRSACLLGGFLEVARATGLPLRCLELGASAGLNQFWDRFAYDLGSAGAWGPAASPVRVTTEWTGGPPPLAAPLAVVERAACDRAPIDLAAPGARRRLAAYVWPDQRERLALFAAAADLALASGARVEAADAVDWLGANGAPRPGLATVVYHSIFWQYLAAEKQAALTEAFRAHGERATPGAPFAWLAMEPAPADLIHVELRLTLWPSGEERVLARVHPHGAAVDWTG